jgi:hypothetical protein
MCIEVDKDTKYPEKGVGFKVFRHGLINDKRRLFGEFCNTTKPRPIGKWLKAEDYSPTVVEGADPLWTPIKGEYEPGWHIFTTHKDACDWGCCDQQVHTVKYRGLIVSGAMSGGKKVIVAREIWILAQERSK